MKTYVVKKSEMIKEHKKIVPMLKKAGLLAEAKKQADELKEIKKK
jgi:hemerythrin